MKMSGYILVVKVLDNTDKVRIDLQKITIKANKNTYNCHFKRYRSRVGISNVRPPRILSTENSRRSFY